MTIKRTLTDRHERTDEMRFKGSEVGLISTRACALQIPNFLGTVRYGSMLYELGQLVDDLLNGLKERTRKCLERIRPGVDHAPLLVFGVRFCLHKCVNVARLSPGWSATTKVLSRLSEFILAGLSIGG